MQKIETAWFNEKSNSSDKKRNKFLVQLDKIVKETDDFWWRKGKEEKIKGKEEKIKGREFSFNGRNESEVKCEYKIIDK